MTAEEAKLLPSGIYFINWKNGGFGSVAGLGRTTKGEIWLAPTNWVCTDFLFHNWEMIGSMELVTTQRVEQAIRLGADRTEETAKEYLELTEKMKRDAFEQGWQRHIDRVFPMQTAVSGENHADHHQVDPSSQHEAGCVPDHCVGSSDEESSPGSGGEEG